MVAIWSRKTRKIVAQLECIHIQYFKLLLTFVMHSVTINYFKTPELIHFQIKIPKRGQARAKERRMLPPAPLKETLAMKSES